MSVSGTCNGYTKQGKPCQIKTKLIDGYCRYHKSTGDSSVIHSIRGDEMSKDQLFGVIKNSSQVFDKGNGTVVANDVSNVVEIENKSAVAKDIVSEEQRLLSIRKGVQALRMEALRRDALNVYYLDQLNKLIG